MASASAWPVSRVASAWAVACIFRARGLGLGLHLGLGGDRLGAEPDLLGLGLGLADAHVAPGGRERRLPVRLGVGGPAHVDLELLLLLLRPATPQRASAR